MVLNPPTKLFKELMSALEQGRSNHGKVTIELSDITVQWAHDGCVAFASGKQRYLCSALQLRGSGLDLPPKQYARENRNHHLSLAFEHIEGKSPYYRCKNLGRYIQKFKVDTWPRVCNEKEPPERLTDAQRHLFTAFKVYHSVPSSASHLSSILL